MLVEPSPLQCDAPSSEWMTGAAVPRGVRGVATCMGDCDDVVDDNFDFNDCSRKRHERENKDAGR